METYRDGFPKQVITQHAPRVGRDIPGSPEILGWREGSVRHEELALGSISSSPPPLNVMEVLAMCQPVTWGHELAPGDSSFLRSCKP